jgi:hypothetical protein
MTGSDESATLQVAGQTVTTRLVSHIHAASKNTGVSFSYLMAQAGKESSFQTEAGSRVSSAAGLFQFTKPTWLSLIKAHGDAHGLGDLASHIHRTRRGDLAVDDPATRQQIFDLRRDPQLSALMAGEYARDNRSWLQKALGRPVDSTDLYLAHFLGPGGAAKVLKAKASDPAQAAAPLLPQAAQKNASVFFEANHSPRSVAAVYDRIRRAIERPMMQYARLEARGAGSAKGCAGGHHAARVAATAVSPAADPVWPFEAAQGPFGPIPASGWVATRIPADDDATRLTYTTGEQSADQISSPMPAVSASFEAQPKSPLGRLLKNLFG